MAYPVNATPFLGSNPSPAYSGTFIPNIWSKKLIQKFYARTVLTGISNTKYEGEISGYGDKVTIRTRPTITISDYEIHQTLAIQRPSSSTVDLLIDKGKYFFVGLDDVYRVQADIDMMNEWTTDAGSQFKIAVDTSVLLSLLGAGNYASGNTGATAGIQSGNINLGATGTPVTVVSDNPTGSQASVIQLMMRLGQVLDEQNVPEEDRWLVMPVWMDAMIKQSELRDASISGDGQSMLRNGRRGRIDRFDIYASSLQPRGVSGGLAAGEWPVYAGHKNGLTFASQFTRTETLRSQASFSDLVRGLQIYGFKVVDTVCMTLAIVKQG